jgi:hypothetical protein
MGGGAQRGERVGRVWTILGYSGWWRYLRICMNLKMIDPYIINIHFLWASISSTT